MTDQNSADAVTSDAANAGIFAKLCAELGDDGTWVYFCFDGQPADGRAVDGQPAEAVFLSFRHCPCIVRGHRGLSATGSPIPSCRRATLLVVPCRPRCHVVGCRFMLIQPLVEVLQWTTASRRVYNGPRLGLSG
ncbi:MAG TPA: hypothetical protein VFK05_35135 [Polyangiaceae bacterium]|nr:hypothetical protein [Polyangiaceae bacterium]